MLMLTSDPGACIGIDVDSGAFVRAYYPDDTFEDATARPFDLVMAPIGEPLDPPDQARPEAVTLQAVPRRDGHLGRRRAARYLQPLVHVPQAPLLGFSGACTPYWTLVGDRPSIALVAPEQGPELRRTTEGDEPPAWECRFNWAGIPHHLPVRNAGLVDTLANAGRRRTGGRDLARILGFAPERVLIALGSPVDGYCCKEVAALLP